MSATIDSALYRKGFGRAHRHFRKLLNLAMDAITSHSGRPLHLSIRFGFMLSGGSLFLAAWLVARYFVSGIAVAGWTSVMVSMFFLSGTAVLPIWVFWEFTLGNHLMNPRSVRYT